MLTTAAAPTRPAPAPTSTPTPKPKPAPKPGTQPRRLRVVTSAEVTVAARRARARLVVFAVAIAAALSLFGIVVAHVLLMQGQFELEGLHRQAAQEQAEYDRLRLQVAELESPDHVVAVAQAKLGMVVPPTIRYLAPSPDALATANPKDGAPAHVDGVASPSWATVKPHLDEG